MSPKFLLKLCYRYFLIKNDKNNEADFFSLYLDAFHYRFTV